MNEQRVFEVVYIRTSLVALWDARSNPEVTPRYRFDTRIGLETGRLLPACTFRPLAG